MAADGFDEITNFDAAGFFDYGTGLDGGGLVSTYLIGYFVRSGFYYF